MSKILIFNLLDKKIALYWISITLLILNSKIFLILNFEHLYKKLSKKYPSNKKKLILLFEHFRIKNLLLQKLKLGLISFELKEFFFAGFKIYEVIEMRYSRQDNTFTDSLKLENRLKSLS